MSLQSGPDPFVYEKMNAWSRTIADPPCRLPAPREKAGASGMASVGSVDPKTAGRLLKFATLSMHL
eukprot:10873499-Heterocapsa_arctica.AAC.1